jgi:hypothetical protein
MTHITIEESEHLALVEEETLIRDREEFNVYDIKNYYDQEEDDE